MKVSDNGLCQHVTTDATRDELAATLTANGLEVEELMPLGEELDGVVVARIVSAEKHPEADRMPVCKVDAGNGTIDRVRASSGTSVSVRVNIRGCRNFNNILSTDVCHDNI